MKKPMEKVVTDNASLLELWRSLMGAGGFARRSIWMIFLDPDGRTLPIIAPIDEIPFRPDRRFIANLDLIAEGLLDGEKVGSIAFLLSRPGSVEMSDGDRNWASALEGLCRRGGWPLHLATRDTIRVFAPEDYLATG